MLPFYKGEQCAVQKCTARTGLHSAAHRFNPARTEADVRCDRIQGGADIARRSALRTEVREGDVQKTAASTDAGSSVNVSLS